MEIIIGLLIMLALLICYTKYEGNSLEKTLSAAWTSGKKSFVVLQIFILIGAITSSWMISGTIPGIVYYGLKIMNPEYYYISAFLITCAVSFLLGSSFGTVGTIGIVLITIGKGMNVDLSIAGWAILSGAFWGDRCSPVSSSASLVATLTETNIYTNIKNMFKTGWLPTILSCALYYFMPQIVVSSLGENILIKEIAENFKINYLIFLPALAILICGAFRVKVKISMGLSISIAFIVAIFLQGENLISVLKTSIIGYELGRDSSLEKILKGGGILSMGKASVIVFISCCLSGVLDQLKFFNKIKIKLEKIKTKKILFLFTGIISLISSIVGCNQSIAVVLTDNFMKNSYEKLKCTKEELALNIENTAIVIAPLVPWNIASLIPMTILGVTGIGFIKYSFFLILLPIIAFLGYFFKDKADN